MEELTSTIYKLDGEGKASTISLDLLRESQLVRQPNGKDVPTRPIQSWELIDGVKALLEERSIQYALDPIYVQKSESQQILTSAERAIYTAENTPIGKWLFNQLITRVAINPSKDGETNTALAISFNKQGLLVAFGQNVRVCQNMCVFGNNLMTTYGGGKVPFDKMMEVLKYWFDTLQEREERDLRVIEAMKGIEINGQKDVTGIIGDLYVRSVRQAYRNSSAPFTMNQMSVLTQDLIARLDSEDSHLATVWDLYNLGTNLYKPKDVDMVNIFHAPKVWYDTLVEYYPVIEEHANGTYITPHEEVVEASVATGNAVSSEDTGNDFM